MFSSPSIETTIENQVFRSIAIEKVNIKASVWYYSFWFLFVPPKSFKYFKK